MQVAFRKSPPAHAITIRRGDGVTLLLRSPTRKFPLPHDLVHFIVERTLGLKDGFWGTVAAGGKFPSMTVVGGRQPPHADERSRALMKANRHPLNEAEVVVGMFQRAMLEPEHVGRKTIHRLATRGRPVARDAIDRTWSALGTLGRQWRDLPVGGEIVLDWAGTRRRRC